MAKNKKTNVFNIAAMLIIAAWVGDKIVTNIINRISFGKPSVSFAGLAGNINFNLTLPVENKNSFSVGVEQFVGELLYGSVLLANITLPQPTIIQAESTTPLSLLASDPINGTFAQLINLVTSGNALQSVRVKGNILVDGKWFAINETIQIL